MNTDKRITDYIERSADFAKPILIHLRKLVHDACPETEETWKWSFPHFDYKGKMMCSMAAFKQHCAFGFRNSSLMKDSKKLFSKNNKTAMGQFGQVKSLTDLPADKILIAYLNEAMKINDDGVKITKPKVIRKEIKIPKYLTEVLKNNKKASVTFENFSPSHKREYLEWLTEAKSEETRSKRLETALKWLSEGKTRNWKYIKK